MRLGLVNSRSSMPRFFILSRTMRRVMPNYSAAMLTLSWHVFKVSLIVLWLIHFARSHRMKRSLGAKTLILPTPTWIVGSYDKQGKPNGMTVAWGGICCSDPPCVAVSLRKATYSYGSLIERRAFTVSVPSQRQVKEADYFGLVSGRETDKFAATGLTPVRSDLVDAPTSRSSRWCWSARSCTSSTWACTRSSSARSST